MSATVQAVKHLEIRSTVIATAYKETINGIAKIPRPAPNASIALLNSASVCDWTLSPEETMVNPLGKIRSQSEGVSKPMGIDTQCGFPTRH